MALTDLELLREVGGLSSEFVWLTCSDGNQTLLVSISRADVDDFAQQQLSRDEQDARVEEKRGTLKPVVQTKYDRGELEQQPDASGTEDQVVACRSRRGDEAVSASSPVTGRDGPGKHTNTLDR